MKSNPLRCAKSLSQAATLLLIIGCASSSEVTPAITFQQEVISRVQNDASPTTTRAPSRNPHVDLYGSTIDGLKWPTSKVFVCWEPGNADVDAKRWTKEAVEATWQKHSALNFSGWETCDALNSGIRIAVRDEGPHVKTLGRLLNNINNGMVLNFTFSTWSTECMAEREACIKSVAVHEFGHAIGFAHEQNRPDAPGECKLKRQGTDPDTMLTPYDPDSVMNYCNKRWQNDGNLSVLDIAAVKELYGPPVTTGNQG